VQPYGSTTRRRHFLALTAAVATAAMAARPARPMPIIGAPINDPILEAIEAHKAAYAEFGRAIDAVGALENEIRANGSRLSRGEDPRLAVLEEALSEASTADKCRLRTGYDPPHDGGRADGAA
jgi:hypothetical protein